MSGPQYKNVMPEKYAITITKESLISESMLGGAAARGSVPINGQPKKLKADDRTYVANLKISEDK